MKAKENKNTQILSWFNKTTQQIIDKYGLDENAVETMLDGVCAELKKHIESTGVSLHNDIETVKNIVEDSAHTILLKIDESVQQTEESIAKAGQKNFKTLSVNLLSQLKKWFDINAAQAKKENKTILDALEKWGKECRFYAEQAKDASVEFLHGFVEERKIAGMSDLRKGRHLLSEGKFDAAYERFNSAKNQDPALSAEAYFYRALACCHIQVVLDSDTGSKVPLIYNVDTANLHENDDFKQAVDDERDENKRTHYVKFAEQVDYILEEYERIEKSNKDGKYDYDCFICVKESDLENPQIKTKDFKWLLDNELFKKLENAQVKVFLADEIINKRKDLPVKKGSNDYNAFILHALQKSRVLLFICSDSAYAQTPWVKNEYMRFMNYHKNPQIVLVGDDPDIKIPNITGKIQVFPKTDIDKIIECIKGKIKTTDYVEPESFYCARCGEEYPNNYGHCIKFDSNKVMCNGILLTATEYANRRIKNIRDELRTKEEAFEQEKEKREQAEKDLKQEKENRVRAETENKKLRDIEKELEKEKSKRKNAKPVIKYLYKNQPVANEVAATRVAQADIKMAQADIKIAEAEDFIRQSEAVKKELRQKNDEIKKQLSIAQGKNIVLENEQVRLKMKFAYIIIAALSVALSVFAIVSKSYLPLWASILRNCKGLETAIDTLLIVVLIALTIFGVYIVMTDNERTKCRRWSEYASWVVGLIFGLISFGILLVGFFLVPIWTGISAGKGYMDDDIAVCDIILIVFLSVFVCISMIVCILHHPKYSLVYITLALCVFNIFAYGFHTVRHTHSESYIYSPRNASRNLEYDYSLDGECYMVKGIGKCSDTDIVIPEKRFGWKVNAIESSAFKNRSSITSITIPNCVTSIGSDAFYGCSSLENIYYTGDISSWCQINGLNYLMTSSRVPHINGQPIGGELVIPDGVISINNSAFYNCSGITSIEISDSVTSIGSSAFSGCSGLTGIIIPDSVTNIGDSAFDGCSGLTIYCEATSQPSSWDTQWNKSDCTVVWDCNNVDGIRYKLKDGYATVSKCVSKYIKDKTIPSSVIIRDETFEITGIGYQAFYYCTSLTSIEIPNGVTSIGASAFQGCWSLTSIKIPNSVTSIGNYGLYFCNSLTSITFNGTIQEWICIDKGSYWNSYTGSYTIHCTDGDITKAEDE